MRLSEQAATFLALESSAAPMHAIGISVLHGTPTLEDLIAQVERKIHLLPLYRKRLAFVPFNIAQPVWVDKQNFKVANHIQVVDLQRKTSLNDAIDQALGLANLTMPRTDPLWRMVLITGLQKNQSLLVHIAHHAILNGVSIGDDAQPFFDLQASPADTASPAEWAPEPAPSGMDLVAEALRDNTREFSDRTRRLRNFPPESSEMIRRATESVTRFITEPVYVAPWNRNLVGPKRQFCQFSVPYADIRNLRRKLGGTENDLVLTVVAEAAARYIAQQDETPQEHHHLRIMTPLRIRREDQHGVRGNRIAGMFPVLDVEPRTALERHKHVRWETESIRQNREAQALQLLSELTPPLPAVPSTGQDFNNSMNNLFSAASLNFATFNPASFLRQLMPGLPDLPVINPTFNSAMAGFNLTCTTVPGAQTTQYVAGCPVEQQLIVPVLAGNLGFGVAVTTYQQTLTFNLVSDPVLLPDIDLMLNLCTEVLRELHTAAEQAAA